MVTNLMLVFQAHGDYENDELDSSSPGSSCKTDDSMIVRRSSTTNCTNVPIFKSIRNLNEQRKLKEKV